VIVLSPITILWVRDISLSNYV